jgi:GH24 family phage-related lysozyme (muramidase)
MKSDVEKQVKAATAISDTALSQICKWETLRDFGYKMGTKDLNGYYVKGENKKTYGYGLRTHPNGNFMQDVKPSWTQAELERLFEEKINKEVQWVLKWANKHGVTLGQGQLDAMVSAVYNYGRTGFLKTGIPAMIAQNPNDPRIPQVWATASDHRKNMGGLHTRRREEAAWYQSDMV